MHTHTNTHTHTHTQHEPVLLFPRSQFSHWGVSHLSCPITGDTAVKLSNKSVSQRNSAPPAARLTGWLLVSRSARAAIRAQIAGPQRSQRLNTDIYQWTALRSHALSSKSSPTDYHTVFFSMQHWWNFLETNFLLAKFPPYLEYLELTLTLSYSMKHLWPKIIFKPGLTV